MDGFQVQNFMIGERFPWEKYCSLGTNMHAVPNQVSFDVVISLPNISINERTAFIDLDLIVDLFVFEDVPFVILNFGDVIQAEVTLNIHKIREEYREGWLNAEKDLVHLYLLEGTNATLQAIRLENMNIVNAVKDVCRGQLHKTMEEIDNVITVVDSNVDIKQMAQNSSFRWTHKVTQLDCDTIIEL